MACFISGAKLCQVVFLSFFTFDTRLSFQMLSTSFRLVSLVANFLFQNIILQSSVSMCPEIQLLI